VKRLGLKARVYGVRYPAQARAALVGAGIAYAGWLPNYEVPRVFARFKVTVHVPRRPYVRALPGVPTIRPFEALACGIPLVCSPWDDVEGLFTPGKDFLTARHGAEMQRLLRALPEDEAMAHELAGYGLETVLTRHTCSHRRRTGGGSATTDEGPMRSGLNIAFFGSSLVPAYWNSAATYYRGIIRALHQAGHQITFHEPDAYERQAHRDMPGPPGARVVVYSSADEEGVYRALEQARGAERRYQVRRLLEALSQGQSRHILLMGDINEWILRSRPLRWLYDRFGAPPAPCTFPSWWPLFALDRIWVLPREFLVEVRAHATPLTRIASDHLPVKAVIAIKPGLEAGRRARLPPG
jgi:endonuclease/exonuclease/phosphatase family metal-dependent hydrolase